MGENQRCSILKENDIFGNDKNENQRTKRKEAKFRKEEKKKQYFKTMDCPFGCDLFQSMWEEKVVSFINDESNYCNYTCKKENFSNATSNGKSYCNKEKEERQSKEEDNFNNTLKEEKNKFIKSLAFDLLEELDSEGRCVMIYLPLLHICVVNVYCPFAC